MTLLYPHTKIKVKLNGTCNKCLLGRNWSLHTSTHKGGREDNKSEGSVNSQPQTEEKHCNL